MKRNMKYSSSQIPIFDLKLIYSYKEILRYYLPNFFYFTLLTNIKGKGESIAI